MGNRFLSRRLNAQKGQSVLETVVAFVLVFLLVGAITKVWLWGNNQLIERQRNYNLTRIPAGQSTDFYYVPGTQLWPVYTPEHLNEADVFPQTE